MALVAGGGGSIKTTTQYQDPYGNIIDPGNVVTNADGSIRRP